MNKLNYASREASQRLVEAGIMLETDHSWVWMIPDAKTGYAIDMTWRVKDNPQYGKLPAPCMAEVWRELPEMCYFVNYKEHYQAWREWVTFEGHGASSPVQESTNPTDALIDLLIWVRKEKP